MIAIVHQLKKTPEIQTELSQTEYLKTSSFSHVVLLLLTLAALDEWLQNCPHPLFVFPKLLKKLKSYEFETCHFS